MKNIQTKTKTKIVLSRTHRLFIFALLITIELAINNSTGLLSSASKNIKDSLQLNDRGFGMFGTMSGLGRVIGSFLFLFIVNKFNRKFILAFFVIIKGLFSMCFKLTTISHILISTRFFIGITHMPPNTYVPIWIDQFGIQNYKTIFMTLMQVAYPVGKVIGYALHMIFGENNWQNGFVFEGVYLVIAGLIIMILPSKYFSANLFVVKSKKGDGEEVKVKIQKIPIESLFETSESFVSLLDKNQTDKKKQNTCTVYKNILTNTVFINGLTIRAILYGINSSLHYWISDYMRNVLLINNNKLIFISYTIIAIVGPLGGIVITSLVNYCLGGYEHRHSVLILFLLHIIASFCGIAIPFVGSLYPFSISVVLYLIFNSAALPILQGLIITSVAPNLKGIAYSIANLVTMLLTSGPAPVVYGIINDKYKTVYPKMGMYATMSCSFVAFVFFVGLIIGKYRAIKKTPEKVEKKSNNNDTLNDKSKTMLDIEELENEDDVEMALKS